MQHQFDMDIAAQYGLAEAVFVHRIYILVLANEANNRNKINGKYWTYDSAAAISKNCPYWTPRQVENLVKKCKEKGLILVEKWNIDPWDRTNWYTVTDVVRSFYERGASVSPCGERDTPKMGEEASPDDVGCNSENGGMDSPEMWEQTSPNDVECNPENGGMESTKKGIVDTKFVECLKEQRKTKENQQRERARARAKTKKTYGEFANVHLSDTEMDKLVARWTESQVAQEIEALSIYQQSRGKRYADHYATLLNWLKRDHPPRAAGSTLIEEDWCGAGS